MTSTDPHAPSFICYDAETANSSHSSMCSLGWVRVTDGLVSHRRHWFIRPQPGWDRADRFNLELTGLNVHDIANGRNFAELGPRLAAKMEGQVVVCHNASADLSMFEQSWAAAGLGPTPGFQFVDTVPIAKRLGLPGKLNLLFEELFNTPMIDHHNALADAEATAACAIELFRLDGKSPQHLARLRPVKETVELKMPKSRGPMLFMERTALRIA